MIKNERMMKIGICDWTLKMVQNENVFQKAKALGFDGVQVAFDIKNINQSLINENVQESYKKKSIQYNMQLCSCAAINYLQTPLALSGDPVLIFTKYIKAMKNLEIKKILVPFFGRGDINARTTPISSVIRSIRKLPPKDIMLGKTIEILKKIADMAEDAQITVGLETLMNAETLKDVLAQIGSECIKVYYDVGNSYRMNYNIIDEIRLLGTNDICQVHMKEEYTTVGSGKINYKNVFELLIDQGYKDWLIIEKSINPFWGLDSSMKKNISYLNGLIQT